MGAEEIHQLLFFVCVQWVGHVAFLGGRRPFFSTIIFIWESSPWCHCSVGPGLDLLCLASPPEPPSPSSTSASARCPPSAPGSKRDLHSSLSLVGMVISVFLAFFIPFLALFFFNGDPLGGTLDIITWFLVLWSATNRRLIANTRTLLFTAASCERRLVSTSHCAVADWLLASR